MSCPRAEWCRFRRGACGAFGALRAYRLLAVSLILAAASPAVLARDAPRLSIQVGHLSAVSSLAWSADGRWLLSGSADDTARLWHVPSGALLRTFGGVARVRGIRGSVQAVGLSADKSTAIVGAADGMRSFPIAQVGDPAVLEPAGEFVDALVVHDSTIAVAGVGPVEFGARPFLRLDDLARGPAKTVRIDAVQTISALAWTDGGRALAVGGSEERVPGAGAGGFVQFVSADGALGQRLAESKPVEWLAAPSGNDVFLLAGGQVVRRRAPSWDVVATYPGQHAALSGDGRLLATVPEDAPGADLVITLRDTGMRSVIQVLNDPGAKLDRTRNHVSSLAFDSDGAQLAVGFSNGRVAVWSVRERRWSNVWQPRPQGAIKSELVNASGTRLAVADGAAVTTWDLRTGRSRFLLADQNNTVTAVATSPDGALVATGTENGTLNLWDTASGQIRWSTFVSRGSVDALLFDRDGRSITSADAEGLVKRIGTEDAQARIVARDFALPHALARTKDGQMLAVGDETGTVRLFQGGKQIRSIPSPKDGVAIVLDADFSPDGRKLAVAYGNGFNHLIVYEVRDGAVHDLGEQGGFVSSVRFSPDGRRIVSGGWDEVARLWDANDGSLVKLVQLSGFVGAVGFTEGGSQLITYAGEVVQFWRPDGSARLLDIVNAGRRGWAVVTPDGRFDAQELDELRGFNWVLPDDLDHPLAPELLMRDYFEPRLLSRMLACSASPVGCGEAFKPIPDLASLNLKQPRVGLRLVPEDSSDLELQVIVSVESDPGGEAYDLRVFRDGQLVAQWPDDLISDSGQDADPEAWRALRRVPIPSGQRTAKKSLRIRLARVSPDQATTLTAYAFNSSRVKSESAVLVVPRRASGAPAPGRAFVVAIGVSASDLPARDLGFAAKDAEDIIRAVSGMRNRRIVPVLLVSERGRKDAGAPLIVDRARKEDVRGVLAILAGNAAARQRLRRRLGAQVDALDRATPDDIVILSFSGHGHVGDRGAFYILPSDSGSDQGEGEDQVKSFISSEELAAWLHPVDAGEMVLILDTCHAAGSVPDGFKPGPLGDPGLGQLAYDKGMRILAATQAPDVAIENSDLGQGLLTYALVQDGLGIGRNGGHPRRPRPALAPADLDRNGEVTLGEWLAYGELRVPKLYQEIAAGTVRLRDSSPVTSAAALPPAFAQTPELFDFSHNRLLKEVIWTNRPLKSSAMAPPRDYWMRR